MDQLELTKIGQKILRFSIKELRKLLDENTYQQRYYQTKGQYAAKEDQWIYDDIALNLQNERKQITKELKAKTFKLSQLKGEVIPTGSIGPDQIEAAKAVPIETYFTGRLRKSGHSLIGKCPFHAGGNERTGSFTIFKNTNRWWCFGCNLGGDVIDFVMKVYNIDFTHAVRNIIN